MHCRGPLLLHHLPRPRAGPVTVKNPFFEGPALLLSRRRMPGKNHESQNTPVNHPALPGFFLKIALEKTSFYRNDHPPCYASELPVREISPQMVIQELRYCRSAGTAARVGGGRASAGPTEGSDDDQGFPRRKNAHFLKSPSRTHRDCRGHPLSSRVGQPGQDPLPRVPVFLIPRCGRDPRSEGRKNPRAPGAQSQSMRSPAGFHPGKKRRWRRREKIMVLSAGTGTGA
jgi:hypothetical protein